MNINLYLDDSLLESLLNASDPDREMWSDIRDMTESDVANMVQNIIDAWAETH